MGPGLADFTGTWALARRIDDRRAGLTGLFEGQARFVPDGAGGLWMEEAGTLRYGDAPPMRATRAYRWRAAGRGRIAVAFDDGRPFHDFATDVPRADHLCGADLYRVRYDFAGWPVWRAIWRVSGPAKDYTMASAFTPADDRLHDPGPSGRTLDRFFETGG